MPDLSVTDPTKNSSNRGDPDQSAQNQGQASSFLPVIFFGPFELDTEREKLYLDGSPTKLVGQPIRILFKLLEKPNEIVTREELCQYLWPGQESTANVPQLTGLVSKLRRAIRDSRTQPVYIETIKGVGYCFVGGLERSQQHGPRFATEQLSSKPEVHERVRPPGDSQAVRNSRFIFWGAIVALIAATVVGFGITLAWFIINEPSSVGGFLVISMLVVAAVSIILATVGPISATGQVFGKTRARG